MGSAGGMQNCILSITSQLAALQRWFCKETFYPSHLSGSKDAEFAAEEWLSGARRQMDRKIGEMSRGTGSRGAALYLHPGQVQCSLEVEGKIHGQHAQLFPSPKKEKRGKKG